jgi:hypothetical protein
MTKRASIVSCRGIPRSTQTRLTESRYLGSPGMTPLSLFFNYRTKLRSGLCFVPITIVKGELPASRVEMSAEVRAPRADLSNGARIRQPQ